MIASEHKHAPWRKSVLIPCWTVQLFFEVWNVALLSAGLALIAKDNYEVNGEEYSKPVINSVVPIWIAVSALCLILTVTEIVLLARHKLKPKTFVIMNTIKTTIWTAIFAYDIAAIVVVVRNDNYGYSVSGFSIIIEAILLLSFWAPLIYGSIIYHRERRNKNSYAAVDHPYDIPIDTTYHGADETEATYGQEGASRYPAPEAGWTPSVPGFATKGKGPMGSDVEMGRRTQLN